MVKKNSKVVKSQLGIILSLFAWAQKIMMS